MEEERPNDGSLNTKNRHLSKKANLSKFEISV